MQVGAQWRTANAAGFVTDTTCGGAGASQREREVGGFEQAQFFWLFEVADARLHLTAVTCVGT